MKIKIEFYKQTGKFYSEESIEVEDIDVWETDKIVTYINSHYPQTTEFDYVFTAEYENMSNQRLIKRNENN